MTISINEVESGMGLMIDGNIYLVLDYNHVKPGKGAAFVRIRMRNVKTDQVLERTFRTADSLEDVPLEERKLQNLYRNGDNCMFMDMASYEEVAIPVSIIGEQIRFLQDHLVVIGLSHNDSILKVILPNFIEAEITHTEPGIKGDSTKAGGKFATIDTGTEIQVPLFINVGDFVKIDTRTGDYIERVKR
ncbi:MAG: elongation factor P [Candidatus Omnitrophica bacterium]|nr:elongation factor P [Candidatus Omnitrophota bacterium]